MYPNMSCLQNYNVTGKLNKISQQMSFINFIHLIDI